MVTVTFLKLTVYFFNTIHITTEIICLRKSEDSVEIIFVCNDTENLTENALECLSCSDTNDIIDLLP